MAQTPPTSVITHFYYQLSRTVLRSSDDPACTCRPSQWHLRVMLSWFRRPLNQSQNHKSHTFIINSHLALHAQSAKWPWLWCDRSAGWFISIIHLCLSDATRNQVMDVWWVGAMCVWYCKLSAQSKLSTDWEEDASKASLIITKCSLPSRCSHIYLRNLCCFCSRSRRWEE